MKNNYYGDSGPDPLRLEGLETAMYNLADEAHRGKISPEEHDHQHAKILERERQRRVNAPKPG